MKKKCLSLFVFSFLFLIVSCNFGLQEIKRNVELTRIEVDTSNARTVFDINTEFSSEGLIIYGYNSDGSKFAIENDYCKIDSGEYNQAETYEGYEIKVSYSGFSTSYFVDVIDTRIVEIEIYQKPLSVYEKLTSKEDLNLDDMIIKVMYANKSYSFWCSENYKSGSNEKDNVEYITEVNGHTIYDFTYVYGIKEDGNYPFADVPVEIYYDNLSVTLSLFVPLSPVSKIEVLGTLNKTNYKPGESISLEGLYLFVTYTNISTPIQANLNILQVIEIEVDPEEKEKKQYTQPIKLKFGEIEISFTKDKDKEVPLSIIRVIDDIIGIEIKPGKTAPAYYYQNEDIERSDFLNNYDVFLKFESGDTSDIPLNDTERESVRFDDFSFDEVGVFPLKAAYDFYNKKNELVEANASYNIMVTDSILLNITAAHNKKTDLSNKEVLSVDFPEGVIPDNNPDYGEWIISGYMSNGTEIEIDPKFCNFEYKKDEHGNEIKFNNKEKIVIINYFDSRYRKDNSPSDYGKTFECEKSVTIGDARLLNVYSTKQEFSVLSGSKINLNDIKICLLGHYTGKQNYEQLISADRDLIKFYGQNNNLIEPDITIDSNKTLYVQIQDRYDLSKKFSIQIDVNVILPQISGIKMEPTDDKVIYITSDPKDFESLNSKPENIIIDENDLKNKFSFQIEKNNNWIPLEVSELNSVKVHYVPEGNYEFYQPVDCRVYATYEKDEEKFTTSYYNENRVVLVPPRISNIEVEYDAMNPAIYNYDSDDKMLNNKAEVIQAAHYLISYTNGKKIEDKIEYSKLGNFNVGVDNLDLYTLESNWTLIKENLGNRNKFKLFQKEEYGYAKEMLFSHIYELEVESSISSVTLNLNTDNISDDKVRFRLGETYTSDDINNCFRINVKHKQGANCKDKHTVNYYLNLDENELQVTVSDGFTEEKPFSTTLHIDELEIIEVLPPEIENVVCDTHGIVYDKYYNEEDFDFILYCKDRTPINFDSSKHKFEKTEETEIKFTVSYIETINNKKDIKNKEYISPTVSVPLIKPIITNLYLSTKYEKINPSFFNKKMALSMFDIELSGIGFDYKITEDGNSFYREGDEDDSYRTCELEFECKYVDDKIVVWAYFTDDYENKIYGISEPIEVEENDPPSNEEGDNDESGEESSPEISEDANDENLKNQE